MMTIEEQLEAQRRRARFIIGEGLARELALVKVTYEGIPPRVSIIGHVIPWVAVELWRDQGAEVVELERITREGEDAVNELCRRTGIARA